MNRESLLKKAKEAGFQEIGFLNPNDMEFLEEVRDMCQSNRCNMYGKCWTCPPACGSLQSISSKAKTYNFGLVVQTVHPLEDSFDFNSMMEGEQLQKKRFVAFLDLLEKEHIPYLPMATGACTICNECTYPDEPCRFPSRAFPSMESYGLLVNQICQASGLEYYHGPNTVTYTACVLFK